jgi:hypothetical protein
MINNLADFNFSSPSCRMCKNSIDTAHALVKVPIFDPTLDPNLSELVPYLVPFIGGSVHRYCWDNWPHREIATKLAIDCIDSEFSGKASCLAHSNEVVAYASRNPDENFAPGILFLPRSTIRAREMFGFSEGILAVRARGKLIEKLVDVLIKYEITPDLDLTFTRKEDGVDLNIQCLKEINGDILHLELYSHKGELNGPYYIYEPDIQLLKQAMLPQFRVGKPSSV